MVSSSLNYVSRLKALIDSEKEIIAFDEMDLNSLPNQNLNLPFNNNPYAYIMYTSGSTGTPKGILKTHKSVVNCTEAISKQYKINKSNKEIIALFSNYVYEPFMRQMLVALLNGQTLVIFCNEIKCDPKEFTNFLNQNNITFLNGTASMLQEYDYTECKTLKKLVFAGEELTESCYNRIRKSFNRVIINEYGPTECTFVSCLKIYQNCEVRDNRSIGKPIENVKCYVLDENMKKVPSGIIGELYISGIGVSEGYFNLPKQTAERFHKNLFQTEAEKTQGIYDKIYKTGDLAKWLPNGELEFLGRNDFQIKINGIRIEPGEIEATLLNHSLIEKAIVVSNLALKLQMEEKFLIGFFISKENVTEEILKSFLSSKLPIYMVPKRIIQILEIPKTISGKIDFSEMSKIYQEAVEISLTNINRKNFDELMEDEDDGIEKVLKEILASLLHISTNFIDDERDIFQIGADSITIIRLISEIRTKMAIELTVTEIYENSKIKMLTKVCKSYQKSEICNSNPKINADESENIFPANNMQQQFLYNSMKTNDDTYVIQYKCEYKTKLNPKIYKKAWKLTLSKFPSLKLKFLIKKDEIYQKITDTQKLEWKFFDLSNSKNYFEESKFIQENDRKRLYNLEAGNLFRIYLLKKKNESKFHLIFSCHHIILDGWSFAVLFNFVHDSYLKVLNGENVFVTEDFAHKNAQKFLNKKNGKSLMNNNYFVNENERPDLNGLLKDDKKNKINISQRNHIICQQEISLKVNSETYTKLENELKDYGITYNSILQFCWTKLLSIYGNCKQISLGTVISGRNIPLSNIVNSVGLYINTLPLMINFEELDKLQICDAIKNLQAKIFEINDGSKCYNSKKYEFDSMFVFENYQSLKNAKDSTEAEKELNFKVLSTFEKLDFPLTFIVTKPEDSLQIKIVFDEELFEQETMEQLLKNMHEVLKKITFNLDSTINDFEVLSTEQEKILNYWNENSKIEYSLNQTLHGIFENKVEENSHKIAVVYENEKLSYKELNKNANQLAHYLQKTNLIKSNSIIALFFDKGFDMIISILGIWKSGAAYVPIDPSYPNDRINFILKDTNASIIITNGIYISKLQKFISSEILIIEAEKYCNGNLAKIDYENLLNMSESRDLAYVIYTSGTTGNPKGVMVEHRNVISFYNGISQRYFNSSSDEGILFLSNYAFDFSIEQFVLSFLSGKKLIIVPENIRIGSIDFYKYLTQNSVTYISGTPSQLQLINFKKLPTLKQITVAGELFQKFHFEYIRQGYNGLLINAYGTTETTVYNFIQVFEKNDKFINSLGKPLNNTKMYVLNESLKEVPPNAIGKLFLSGECVTRGYLNRLNENSKSFIKFKEKNDSENVLYNTGDLVRWSKDGNLEYIGRDDFQVKINGVRIDLSEIKNTVLNFENIQECAVIVDEKCLKQKQIIVYYVSTNNKNIDKKILFNFLNLQLPRFMIPKKIIQIFEHLPLTSNGKLDERVLSKLNCINLKNSDPIFTPPTNYLEEKLCQIWANLLNLSKIGINDDFFELGGDSILVMQLSEQIYNDLKINVSLKDIFIHRCIKNLAPILQIQKPEIKNEITDLKIVNGKSDFYPLLPIQKWFFEKNLKNLHHWNQTFTIKIQKEIDFGKLQKALIKLFQLHEAFRLRFKKTESGYLQYYDSMDSIKDFKLKCLSIKKLGIQKVNKIIENSQANLNIYNGPLFFVYYLNEFKNNHGTLKIIFSMHHLIVDVVSWRIICRDLERIYNDDAINRSSMTSYLKWVHTLNCYFLNNGMENEKEWWKKLIEKCSKYNQTLLNKINFSKEHQKYNFSISVEQTEYILRYSNQKFQIKSINTILLAALGHSLHSLTGQKYNYITMEGHGRESDCLKDSNININNTIGWFTTMYPFEILSTENLKEEIENIKNFEANIPYNGIGFGCIFGYKNLPKICFNYLGQLDKFNKSNNSSWEIDDFDSDYNSRNDITESALSSDKNVIDSCAFVTNGKMEFRISSKFETSKTEEFIINFKKTFDEIFYICKNDNPKNDSIFNPYLEFHKEKTDTIFVLPPGEGGAESYSRIIHKLSNFHMILFNNYYLYCKQNYEKNDLTIEILAKFYIKYVKSLQPKGPYTFIGWSFGGVISFEITRQLINEGQEVENLIFMDSYFNVSLAIQSTFGKIDKTIIDKINILYSPDKTKFDAIFSKVKNITLFRAEKLNTMFKNEDEKKFYEYYMNSKYNNLETLINYNLIKVINMNDDNHISWIFNESLTSFLADYVTKLFLKSNSLKE